MQLTIREVQISPSVLDQIAIGTFEVEQLKKVIPGLRNVPQTILKMFTGTIIEITVDLHPRLPVRTTNYFRLT